MERTASRGIPVSGRVIPGSSWGGVAADAKSGNDGRWEGMHDNCTDSYSASGGWVPDA